MRRMTPVEADAAFFAAVRTMIRPEILLEEVDTSINEASFVEAALGGVRSCLGRAL